MVRLEWREAGPGVSERGLTSGGAAVGIMLLLRHERSQGRREWPAPLRRTERGNPPEACCARPAERGCGGGAGERHGDQAAMASGAHWPGKRVLGL